MPAYFTVHIVKTFIPFSKTFLMLSLLLTHDSFYLCKWRMHSVTQSCEMKCNIFLYQAYFFL